MVKLSTMDTGAGFTALEICLWMIKVSIYLNGWQDRIWKEIQKIPSNDKVIGPNFSMFELFFSSENQRADYLKYFRILEEGLKNYRNHYQEK